MSEIATFVYALGILGLFLLNHDRKVRTSAALSIPVAWLLLNGSRTVSEWLNMTPVASVDQQLDGSPLDRFVYTVLLALGLLVLASRRRQVGMFLRANAPIVLFFFYCAVSTFWSDYPWVAFKRWTKALSDFVMVLIVLTDPDPSAAIKRCLTRASFLLLPVSVLLVKYYPDLGRGYEKWTGAVMNTGVTTNKNLLGMVCMLLGVGCVWRLSQLFRSGRGNRKFGLVIAQSATLAMVLWLLWKANSVTSLACFLLGSCIIVLTGQPAIVRRKAIVHVIVLTVLFIPLTALFLEAGASFVLAVGRDPTLTGRTEVWQTIIAMAENPILGAGFDSFWLGERLQKLWSKYWWQVNESHNGYIEVYLNLGLAGLTLLSMVIVTGYRRLVDGIHWQQAQASLGLAYLVVALMYNLTESAFKTMHLVWIFFLLAATAVPKARKRQSPAQSATDFMQSAPTAISRTPASVGLLPL